jgi:hypothetical protein
MEPKPRFCRRPPIAAVIGSRLDPRIVPEHQFSDLQLPVTMLDIEVGWSCSRAVLHPIPLHFA